MKKISLCIIGMLLLVAAPIAAFTIMIDPAGDVRTTGRQMDDSFERGITLQCAQRLAQELEARYHGLKVVLTRLPGETVQELQNANFANRMSIDLYLSIHFFQDTQTVPHWYFYTFAHKDDHLAKPSELSFYRYDQAHVLQSAKSKEVAQLLQQSLLRSQAAKKFHYEPPMSLPFKPLVGIKAPAVACEIGLKTKDGWISCIEPLLEAIDTLLTRMF